MSSGALASVIGTPFDIALVRMQADSLKPAAGALARYACVVLHRICECSSIKCYYLAIDCNEVLIMITESRTMLLQNAGATKTFLMRWAASHARRA